MENELLVDEIARMNVILRDNAALRLRLSPHFAIASDI